VFNEYGGLRSADNNFETADYISTKFGVDIWIFRTGSGPISFNCRASLTFALYSFSFPRWRCGVLVGLSGLGGRSTQPPPLWVAG